MLDIVKNGTAAALIQERSFVEYITATNCAFMALPESFHVLDLAIGYPTRMPHAVIR